jgi:hypothetical protein
VATGTKRKVSPGASKKVGKAKRQRKRGALSSGLRAARDLVAGAVAIGLGLVPSKEKRADAAKKAKTSKKATPTKATKATKKKPAKKKASRKGGAKKK